MNLFCSRVASGAAFAFLLHAIAVAGASAAAFAASGLSYYPLRPDDPKAVYLTPAAFPVRGDGQADDSAALQSAIDRVSETTGEGIVFLPEGRYRITRTIYVWPGIRVIGHGAKRPVILLPDRTPGYQQGVGAMIFFAGFRPGSGRVFRIPAPPPGPVPPNPSIADANPGTFYSAMSNVDIEIGEGNPAAVAVRFHVAQHGYLSHMDFRLGSGLAGIHDAGNAGEDLHFHGGRYGILTRKPSPAWQYTLIDLWTPSTFAQSGLYISDTKTPGRACQVSSEHHVRTEIKLDQVENWELYALQTEGERGESEAASSLEISRSRNLTIANFHGYRVTRSMRPFPYAIRISESSGIRFRNVHVDANSSAGYCLPSGECTQIVRASKYSYGTCILDADTQQEVRNREFAFLDYPGMRALAPVSRAPKVERLATGFYNLGGGAVDAAGRLYFVDARWQRIFRWAPETRRLTIVRDNPLDPVNLAFDKAGNLLVVSNGGSGMAVYAFKPDGPEDELTLLEREPAAERPAMQPVLPASYWVNGDFTNTLNTATYEYTSLEEMFFRLMQRRKTFQYVSPDRTVFIPSDEVFVQGPPHLRYKWAHILQAYGLSQASPGQPFYVTNEAEQKTYRARVNSDGTLADPRPFANQGGESLTQDAAGNVYLAAGQIFIYNPAGKVTGVIPVPERPLQLVLGGKDRRTLYILTSTTLYSTRIP